MKTLTIINTVLSSILIPVLFSSLFFPNEPSRLQHVESVVCENPHNASNIIVEDNMPDRVVLDDSVQEAKVIVEDNLHGRVVLDDSFQGAIKAMRSKGYKVMASFLESQLLALDNMAEYSNDLFYVYAPSDEAVARAELGFGELHLILLRHITSSRLSRFSDDFDLLRTFLPGFVVTWYPDMLNCEVPYNYKAPIYRDSGRLYVYGLPEILSPLTEEEILPRRGGLSRPCHR